MIHYVILSERELAKLQQNRENARRRSQQPSHDFAVGVSDTTASCWSTNNETNLDLASHAVEHSSDDFAAMGEIAEHDDATDLHVRTDAHLPELCEGCKKFGDCSGAFMDPFTLFVAAILLEEEHHGTQSMEEHDDVQWQRVHAGDGWELVTESFGVIQMVPHVFEEEPRRIGPEEAADIVSTQMRALRRSYAHASDTSSSDVSGRSSMRSSSDRAPNSQEYEAVRRRFGGV